MTCTCHPSSPFLWRTNKGDFDTTQMRRSAQLAAVSTKNVNDKRRQGIEPMILSPMSNKPLAHTLNPRAAALQPTMKRKK